MEIVRKGEAPVITIRKKEPVVWLGYPAFDALDGFVHGFSTRLGGVSEGYLSSMNLSFARGDREEAVRENFHRIADAIGFLEEQLVFSHQTHTTNVRRVTRADCGKGILRERDYHDVDGLITNEPGVVLTTSYADCVPLFFVDPVQRAVGLSHSGWRGTVGKIGKITVEMMREEYGSDPKNIIAAIGPSICQSCYQVSEDVIGAFRESFAESDWEELFYAEGGGKYRLNLWKANEKIFLEAGILPEHISVTDLCTCCNSEFLYSHRASKGMRGNLAAFLGIRE